jgi:hypothetical protein
MNKSKIEKVGIGIGSCVSGEVSDDIDFYKRAIRLSTSRCSRVRGAYNPADPRYSIKALVNYEYT